jgi:hypothetical protein
MPGVFLLAPGPVFIDSDLQTVHSDVTVTASGGVAYAGFGVRNLILVVNVTEVPTGSSPTITYSMQEIDPGNETTPVGSSVTGEVLTGIGTQILQLPLTLTGVVQVSWEVTGAGASFTGVYATLVTKISTVDTGLDSTGAEHPLLVDPAGRQIVDVNGVVNTVVAPTQQVVLSNETLASSGSTTFSGFGFREVSLIVNIKAVPTGVQPTIVWSMQEIDPGDGLTVVGSSIIGAQLSIVSTQVLTLPLTVTGVVRVTWTITGTSPSFTNVYATIVSKSTTANSGVDYLGVERVLLVDTSGRTANIDPPDQGAANGLSLVVDPSTGNPTNNYFNNTAPVLAALSNTTPGYLKLGGKFLFATPNGSEEDYALFAYQVPAGYYLYVDSIEIGSVISGANSSSNPTVIEWGCGANASMASLGAAALFPPTLFTIGTHTSLVDDIIGSPFLPGNLIYAPRTPIVVQPSRWFHIICRIPLANATPQQTIRGFVTLAGFFQPVGNIATTLFLPTQVPGLLWWLRADLGIISAPPPSLSVGSWLDQSGEGDPNRNMVQTVSSSQPTLNVVDTSYNRQATLSFLRTNGQFMDMFGVPTYAPLSQPTTLFIVGNDDGLSEMQAYLGDTLGTNYRWACLSGEYGTDVGTMLLSGVSNSTAPKIFMIEFNDPTTTERISQYTSSVTGNASAGTIGQLELGGTNGGVNTLNGKIAEVIMYSALLTFTQRQAVLLYLSTRYGIVMGP